MHQEQPPTKLSTPQMQIKQHKEPPISTDLTGASSQTTSDKFSPQLSQPLVHILPTPLSLAERADRTIENGELETLLVAAPASIVALADLCYLSSTTPEFDLNAPLKGFMILKREKFRPGLHQVVNKASTAFTAANRNVAKIVIHSKQIPPLVMDILHLIVEGEPGDLEMTFPELQQSVIEKATKCIELSNEVAKEFESLFDLLSELNEAFTATSSAQISREGGESKPEDSNTQIQKALTDGLLALNRVRKQWTHLSRFFGELARIIKEETYQPLVNFIEVAQRQTVVKLQDAISAFAKQTLRSQAHLIARKGYIVHSLATTYLEIMMKRLNGPLLTLDQLLSITAKGAGSVEQMRKDIQLKCEQSQFAIIRIFEDNLATATKDLSKALDEIGNEKGEEDEGEEDPHA